MYSVICDHCYHCSYDLVAAYECLILGRGRQGPVDQCSRVICFPHDCCCCCRHTIMQTCRQFKVHFRETRERSSKALGFAKMLRKVIKVVVTSSMGVTAKYCDECVCVSVCPRNIWGKHLPDKPNTYNSCELDWSLQRHTTEADAWMSLLSAAEWAVAHCGRSLISTIALLLYSCLVNK